jgi:hypothetical protein
MAAYCTETDLLISGNLPVPTGFNKVKYVQDAADEINMRLGQRYTTPIVFATVEQQEAYGATLLLLKQLNVHLATGRLIMALDARGENEALHAYGAELVRGALELIREILDGKITLEGVRPANGSEPADNGSARPVLLNLDPVSQVESFYSMFDPRNSQVNTLPWWMRPDY